MQEQDGFLDVFSGPLPFPSPSDRPWRSWEAEKPERSRGESVCPLPISCLGRTPITLLSRDASFPTAQTDLPLWLLLPRLLTGPQVRHTLSMWPQSSFPICKMGISVGLRACWRRGAMMMTMVVVVMAHSRHMRNSRTPPPNSQRLGSELQGRGLSREGPATPLSAGSRPPAPVLVTPTLSSQGTLHLSPSREGGRTFHLALSVVCLLSLSLHRTGAPSSTLLQLCIPLCPHPRICP